MRNITSTELARNLRQVLDNIMSTHEEYVIERNHRQIARIIPGAGRQTAMEAMADLYRTLPEEAAKNWIRDSQGLAETISEEIRNPWGFIDIPGLDLVVKSVAFHSGDIYLFLRFPFPSRPAWPQFFPEPSLQHIRE